VSGESDPPLQVLIADWAEHPSALAGSALAHALAAAGRHREAAAVFEIMVNRHWAAPRDLHLYARLQVAFGQIERAAQLQATSQFLAADAVLARRTAARDAAAAESRGPRDVSGQRREPGAVRTAILGFAAGYGWGQIRVFVVSLRRSGFAGEIALFVDSIDDETRANASRYGVTLVESSSHLLMRCHLCVARYFRYCEYLCEHPCDKVMLSDVRDVYFQGDPFAMHGDVALAFFAEDARMTIGECVSNRRWIRLAAPAGAAADHLMAKPIACSGTTLGTHASVMRYLESMMCAFFRVEPAHLFVQGIDQGFHNWLVHGGKIDGARLFPNGRWIDTLGYVEARRISLGADGKIVGSAGEPCPVIHQYDRHPWLRKHIEATI
jgi:hypothetical protein